MDVYVNGNMLDLSQRAIRVDDAGLLHGVGLFETMAVHHGRVFRLQGHLERLTLSASSLGLSRNLDSSTLQHAIEATIRHNQIDRGRLRLTVTAGALSLLNEPPRHAPQPTIMVTPSAPTIYDPACFESGIMVQIAGQGANPFDPLAGHKILNYWSRLHTLRQAAAVNAGEAIWLNTSNHLASGAVSNLFLVKDGCLKSPFARGEEVPDALPAPVLPGVTRQVVLEIASSKKIPIECRMLSVEDLLEADEVFLTNSSWGVLPVTRVEKRTIADGKVGQMTSQLRSALLKLMDTETAANNN